MVKRPIVRIRFFPGKIDEGREQDIRECIGATCIRVASTQSRCAALRTRLSARVGVRESGTRDAHTTPGAAARRFWRLARVRGPRVVRCRSPARIRGDRWRRGTMRSAAAAIRDNLPGWRLGARPLGAGGSSIGSGCQKRQIYRGNRLRRHIPGPGQTRSGHRHRIALGKAADNRRSRFRWAASRVPGFTPGRNAGRRTDREGRSSSTTLKYYRAARSRSTSPGLAIASAT